MAKEMTERIGKEEDADTSADLLQLVCFIIGDEVFVTDSRLEKV